MLIVIATLERFRKSAMCLHGKTNVLPVGIALVSSSEALIRSGLDHKELVASHIPT